jgi:superfamily II DNA/RNA helicase
LCRYICLDEADRMLDMGFDEEASCCNCLCVDRQIRILVSLQTTQ